MNEVLQKLTHGLYVLTTKDGGCIVDAVMQASFGDEPLVAISVMKRNNTNELLKKDNKARLSIIGKKTNSKVIPNFGFKSMRDANKFEYEKVKNDSTIPYIEDSIGYLDLEKVDSIDNDTHTLFLFKVVGQEMLNDGEELTYNYYKDHKDEFLK